MLAAIWTAELFAVRTCSSSWSASMWPAWGSNIASKGSVETTNQFVGVLHFWKHALSHFAVGPPIECGLVAPTDQRYFLHVLTSCQKFLCSTGEWAVCCSTLQTIQASTQRCKTSQLLKAVISRFPSVLESTKKRQWNRKRDLTHVAALSN